MQRQRFIGEAPGLCASRRTVLGLYRAAGWQSRKRLPTSGAASPLSDFLPGSPLSADCQGKSSLFLPRSPSLLPNSSPRLPLASRSHVHTYTHTHTRTLLPKTVVRPPPQLTSFQRFFELDNPRICKSGERRERPERESRQETGFSFLQLSKAGGGEGGGANEELCADSSPVPFH